MNEQSIVSSIQGPLAEKAPSIEDQGQPNWQRVCICGHLEEHHGEGIGGTHPTVDPIDRLPVQLDGCTGAMRATGPRRADRDGRGRQRDRSVQKKVGNRVVNEVPVTCPCTEFRPVATVDRGAGRFRQRVHRNNHPMVPAMRGQLKIWERMADRQGIDLDTFVASRFEWLVELRCEQCRSTDGAFPSYTVPGREFGMLCAECRDKARATLIL